MMSCLTNEKGDLLLAPGDVLDKLSILFIKKQKIEDPLKKEAIQEDINRTSLLWRNMCHELEKQIGFVGMGTASLFGQLYKTNLKQWDLEDRVRTEDSWEAAQAARENNTLRVNLKNDINDLLGYCIEEIKEYKSK